MQRVSLAGTPYNFEQAFVLAGAHFAIGTRVVKWTEPGGFNAYEQNRVVVERENRRTGKTKKKIIKGKRYSTRKLKDISQFFIHHTGGPLPHRAFKTLHNDRKLSVHFIVDDKGLIYQTLDAIECAWHAGKHNKISIGVECCLYPDAERHPEYYSEERCKRLGMSSHDVMIDRIHRRDWEVFAFTEKQVEALARLAAGTWVALQVLNESIEQGPPHFARGNHERIPRTVVDNARDWRGLIGHLQATRRKVDPAGFPWERFEAMAVEYHQRFWEVGKSVYI